MMRLAGLLWRRVILGEAGLARRVGITREGVVERYVAVKRKDGK